MIAFLSTQNAQVIYILYSLYNIYFKKSTVQSKRVQGRIKSNDKVENLRRVVFFNN